MNETLEFIKSSVIIVIIHNGLNIHNTFPDFIKIEERIEWDDLMEPWAFLVFCFWK